MRSKRSLKNSARAALNSSCIAIAVLCLSGCFFSSGKPSYNRENIAKSLSEISQSEYKIDVKARLVGSTLYTYMPVEDLFIKLDKQKTFKEKFQVIKNEGEISDEKFSGEFLVKAVPQKDKKQEYEINKKISEKIGTLWRVVRRVLFSLDASLREELKFVVMVISDIKNGFEVKEIFYIRDLKKVSYGLMSVNEFQHRVIQDSFLSPLVIGDKTGRHVEYKDLTLEDFVREQIEYRVSLKFQKPEVEQTADIEKEIQKIVSETLTMYELKGIKEIKITNPETQETLVLDQSQLWPDIKKR